MNQRAIPITLTGQNTNTKTFRTPANPNIAPPGYYMLFLVNDQGIPSTATWVRLRPGATENPVVPAATPPPGSPPAGQPVTALPSVRAKIVRHRGKRVMRVTVGRSTAARARIELLLRNRRSRTVRKGTRTLRTGRTTVVRSPKVPRSARTVRARVRSLVAAAALPSRPSARTAIVRRGGRRVIRLVLGRSSAKTVRVVIELRSGRGKVVKRVARRLRTGRIVVLRSPRVTPAIRSVRVRLG